MTFSVHDRGRTLPQLSPEMIVSCDDPEPGDRLVLEREGGVVRLNHYFEKEEIAAMCGEAGFNDLRLWYTSELGEQWDNVFVGAAQKNS